MQWEQVLEVSSVDFPTGPEPFVPRVSGLVDNRLLRTRSLGHLVSVTHVLAFDILLHDTVNAIIIHKAFRFYHHNLWICTKLPSVYDLHGWKSFVHRTVCCLLSSAWAGLKLQAAPKCSTVLWQHFHKNFSELTEDQLNRIRSEKEIIF